MPFFKYTCEACGYSGERLVCGDRDKTCQRCDETIELEKEVTSPIYLNILKEFTPYVDPVLGYVSSRRQRKQRIKEEGLIEFGGEDPETVDRLHQEKARERKKRELSENDHVLMRALEQAGKDVPLTQIIREIQDSVG